MQLGLCPIRSTAGQAVQCVENCQWHVKTQDDESCAVAILAQAVARMFERQRDSDEQEAVRAIYRNQ